MFSKAKRFEPHVPVKNQSKGLKKLEIEKQKPLIKASSVTSKPKQQETVTPLKDNIDTQSQCSSSIQSVKSFVTPRSIKTITTTKATSLKKPLHSFKSTNHVKVSEDIIKAQEAEIRNKDYTISEYYKQIEDLKSEIVFLQKQVKEIQRHNDCKTLENKFSHISLYDVDSKNQQNNEKEHENNYDIIDNLKIKIVQLEQQCCKLEQEVSNKQVELSSLEEVINIRDSLCKDLQEKLTNTEASMEETHQRLEMVKGHHALALEANESIRREYKAELETLKVKMEEEKQAIINKYKTDQDCIKSKYNSVIESMTSQLQKEKDVVVKKVQQQLIKKDLEMKAKLEQIDEATQEKLKLCEIQFEERSRGIQEHLSQQEEKVQHLEKRITELKCNLNLAQEQNIVLQKDINNLKNENEILKTEKENLIKELGKMKDESKKKIIDFENEINKLTVEVDKVNKEKNKFEMSLSVTRDIVQVLTMRLRESDNELEHLENTVEALTNSKEVLENELSTYKNSLNNTVLECNEYKEALVNILKSKAALAKEHTRIMEHNVSLIESLQNVEKEAYRELGTIKNELIEDVELLKKESNSQIQMLCEEVEKKRMLCKLATEHAGQATAAAEQSRALLSQAAAEITHLETENQRLQQQIQDQQSLVVELSLLRQENEELTMTIAKQSSIVDKMKKEIDQTQAKPKSPSVIRKTHKIGKENIQTVISPLRERNQ